MEFLKDHDIDKGKMLEKERSTSDFHMYIIIEFDKTRVYKSI